MVRKLPGSHNLGRKGSTRHIQIAEMKRGGRWTYTVVCVMMAIGRFEMDTEINWNGKLQVVHTDGRVVDLAEHEPWGNPSWPLKAMSADGAMVFYMDPSRNDVCAGAIGDGWTIRNVASVFPTPDERAVAPELVARLVAVVKDVALDEIVSRTALRTEARSIVAALEPSDRTEAKRLADIWEIDAEAAYQILARGRQLERASRDVTPCTREQFEEDCRA